MNADRDDSGEPPIAGASEETTPLRVLAVDDHSSARAALASAVRALGYACRVAADGHEAWALHCEEPS